MPGNRLGVEVGFAAGAVDLYGDILVVNIDVKNGELGGNCTNLGGNGALVELTGGHAVPAVVASANGVVHFDVRVDPEAVLGSVPIGLAAGAREAVVGINHRRHFNNCGLLLHRRFLNLIVKSLPQFNIDLAQADGARMARLPESRLGQISVELCV